MRAPGKIRSDCGTETVELYGVHTTFHRLSPIGEVGSCYNYGKSVHNQKIECFWSQFVTQFLVRWQEEFYDIEISDLWQKDDSIDEVVLLYIYMPILRAEISIFREEYNNYPIRRNHLSRLPYGRPYDNFFLRNIDIDIDNDFSIPIDESWFQLAREQRIHPDFDSEQYLDPVLITTLDTLILHSPLGSDIHIGNARDQYLFLRNCLKIRN